MSKKGTIRVATCQFAVTASISRNAAQIRRQIMRAKRLRADVVHFSEAALSGYAGAEFNTWDGFDWEALRVETEAICRLAAAKRVWVILGSAHRLTGKHLPHNCLYIIGPNGCIVDRYDKRFCTTSDLNFYTPGDHLPVFVINGVRCGTLICFDLRFPEIYRKYRKLGVDCIFQSFHNARAEKGPNVWTAIMRPTMQCHAATNYFWVSMNNSSAWYQSWSSAFIRPDGTVAASLPRHRAAVMVNTVDTRLDLYDPSRPFRDAVMRGILHTGRTVRDPRSSNRQTL